MPLFSVRVLDAMRGTGPWVRLVSALSFVGALTTLAAAVLQASRSDASSFYVGYVWGLAAALYVAPGVLLHRYAQAIAHFTASGESRALERALSVQRTFWRTLGVVTLVMVSVIVALMLGAIVFA
jgi:hypothetical protein